MEEILNEFENLKIPEPTNSWWVKLDSDNRICMITSTQQEEEQFLFDFPQDFDIGSHNNYKIVDGELIYDEMVYPEIEVQPTEEQLRIAALEEQLAMTNEALAMADEVSIELYETVMAQEEVNNAQDDALIDIYEQINNL